VIQVLEFYLHYRQFQTYLRKEVPQHIKPLNITQEEFEAAQSYGYDKSVFGFVKMIFDYVFTLVVFFGILPWFWDLSASVMKFLNLSLDNEIIRSLVFIILFMLLNKVISIPFELYSIFVIEAKHKFNNQTFSLYLYDLFVGIAIQILFACPILAGFIKLIQWGGDSFYIYVFSFILVVQIAMIYIFPTFIQPLFNKFEPLQEGELKTRIEELAKSVSFPLTKIYVMDGSKRSDHSNAYFYGFWNNKRIVLYDTLQKKVDDNEIIAILCHELGHWKFNHMLKMLFITEIHIYILLYLFSFFIHTPALYTSFGFNDQPIIIGFILFSTVYSPVDNIISFIMHIVSRKHEFEADSFASHHHYTQQLKSGLIKLHTENKSNVDPDKWYAIYHYSHPPLLERLMALKDDKGD